MVVCTVAAVGTVLTGGTAAAAGAALGTAAGSAGATGGRGAIATAVGVGLSGGAITGAMTSGTSSGALIGAAAGGTSAAGVGGSGAGLALAVGTGGTGLLALGTSESADGVRVTYDCWKPVLHDTSVEPSNGMLMKDVVCHPNIAKVTMTGGNPDYPSIVLENIWNERFEIEYLVFVETGTMACHAKPILDCE